MAPAVARPTITIKSPRTPVKVPAGETGTTAVPHRAGSEPTPPSPGTAVAYRHDRCGRAATIRPPTGASQSAAKGILARDRRRHVLPQ